MGDKHLIDARPYLFPAPCVVVSCSDGEATNLITLAWAGTVCSEPPQVGIGVRKSRYSHGLLNTGGDFVVNIPAAEHTRAVDFCGVRSGREVDKWEAVGLTPLPAAEVGSPLVAEFPINLECAVRRVLELGSHDLFIGEVLVVHVTTSLLNAEGELDPTRFESLVYSFGGLYHTLGAVRGSVGFSIRE